MASKQQERLQAAEKLADYLRNAVTTGSAKVQQAHGQVDWMDYSRGKDIARHLVSKPDAMQGLVRLPGPDRTVEEAVREAGEVLVERGMLMPCDRKFKKPHPGRTKLVKFPRSLERARGVGWDEGAFYVYLRDKPRSAWFYFSAFLMVLGVVAVTLFPLAPHWAKLAVTYFLMSLIALILGAMLLRYVVWAVTWITTGHHLWILPNLTSDTVPITELFSPVVSFDRAAPGDAQLLARGVLLAALLGGGYALSRSAPDAGNLKGRMKDAHSSLMDFLDINLAKRSLGDAGNATTKGAAAGASQASSAGKQHAARAPERKQQQEQQEKQEPQEKQEERGEGEPAARKRRRKRKQAAGGAGGAGGDAAGAGAGDKEL